MTSSWVMWHGWLSEGNEVLISHHHFVDSKYDDHFTDTIGTRAYEHGGATYLEWSDIHNSKEIDTKMWIGALRSLDGWRTAHAIEWP